MPRSTTTLADIKRLSTAQAPMPPQVAQGLVGPTQQEQYDNELARIASKK